MTCLLQYVALSSLLALPPGDGIGQIHLQDLRAALRLREQGRSHEAGVTLERLAREPGLEPALMARVQNALGLVRRDQARWKEAVTHFEDALKAVPSDTTDCALRPALTGNLGEARLQQGRLREARALFESALRMSRGCGNEVFASLQLLNLSGLARMQGDYDLARRFAEGARTELKDRLGETHPHSVLALNNLAQVYAAQGRQKQAIEAMERVKELAFKVHGERHPLYSGAVSNLAVAYYSQQRYAEAETLLRQALAADEATYGPRHPSVLRDLSNLAAVLDSTDRTEEAESLLRRVIETSRANGQPEARALASLGTIELARGRVDEASRWFSELSTLIRRGAVVAEADVAKRLEQFASALRTLNRPADAERYQAEATRLRTKALIDTEALRTLNYSELWKGNRQ